MGAFILALGALASVPAQPYPLGYGNYRDQTTHVDWGRADVAVRSGQYAGSPYLAERELQWPGHSRCYPLPELEGLGGQPVPYYLIGGYGPEPLLPGVPPPSGLGAYGHGYGHVEWQPRPWLRAVRWLGATPQWRPEDLRMIVGEYLDAVQLGRQPACYGYPYR